MKSFKQYIKESTVLMDLINKHDDPFSFLADAMNMLSNGTLKLKKRGVANARELVRTWNRAKKKKIKIDEAAKYTIKEVSLNELFEKPYPIKDVEQNFGTYKGKRIGSETIRFRTDSNTKILVEIEYSDSAPKNGQSVWLQFVNENQLGKKGNPYGLTGEGNTGRILGTVIKILQDIIEEIDPKLIEFEASKGDGYKETTGRVNAYKAIVKRFGSKYGYKMKLIDTGRSVNFKLEKK